MEEGLETKWIWRFVYKVWPPVLRVLEKLKFHNYRQEWLIGYFGEKYCKSDLVKLLEKNGFENAILTWKDPGEVLSMRKVDKKIFQYHIRLFDDGEIRVHYEYSSEGGPWKHCVEDGFKPCEGYFKKLLGDYLRTA